MVFDKLWKIASDAHGRIYKMYRNKYFNRQHIAFYVEFGLCSFSKAANGKDRPMPDEDAWGRKGH